MAFTKFLSTFAILLSIFSTTALSMTEDDGTDLEKKSRTHVAFVDEGEAEENTPILNVQKKEEGCFPHWGLSHWFSGIGEYIQICFCILPYKRNGRYERESSNNERNYERIYSDCRCEQRGLCCYGDDVCYQACTAIVCCPCAALTHLYWLPSACWERSPRAPEYVYNKSDEPLCESYSRPSISHPTYHVSDEANARAAKARSHPYYYKGSHPSDDLAERVNFKENGVRIPRTYFPEYLR